MMNSNRILTMVFAAACSIVFGAATAARAEVVYSETFDAFAVPANWTAFNGTNGQALLGILDDASGIGGGNALSIDAFTRQAAVGKFNTTSFVNVGDKIELSFDVRLTDMVNNAGGFRMGLYYDHEGQQLSSGYRALMGTGTGAPRTDVQADGGDTVDGDIGFGVNRENPIGFMNRGGGFPTGDNLPHSLVFSLTRTADGVMIDVIQDGESTLIASEEPVVHIPGTGAGVATPLQTTFNQIVFTSNGGFIGLIDNVQVTYTEAAATTPGDFNGDGNVDGADFVIWQTNFPKQDGGTLATGDANGDGAVDGADFVIWQTNFPTVAGSMTPVPEPATIALAFSAALACVVARRRVR